RPGSFPVPCLQPRRSVRPAGIARFDAPLPRRGFSGGEVVVVAAGEGLEGDEDGVLGGEQLGAGGGGDVGGRRGATDGAPAERWPVLPEEELHRPFGAAAV